MKMKYLFHGLLAFILLTTSCQDPDEIITRDSESLNTLSVTGTLFTNDPKGETEYKSVINENEGTITLQIPYYISDTEAIQGDLENVKLIAALPNGAKFEPSLSGIHNLAEGIRSTLIRRDGSKKTYTIKAVYVKSSLTNIDKVELTEFSRLLFRTDTENKQLYIIQTSSAVIPALNSAKIIASPWSTITVEPQSALISSEKNTANIDLSQFPKVIVTAQDGTEFVYETKLEQPKMVPAGEGVGYIAALFGMQLYKDNTEGFEIGANRSMAIVGDYLIISNSNDFNKMIILDRFTGKALNKRVNTTAIQNEDPNHKIHAITTDDAGHLVAMTYVSNGGSGITTSNQNVRVWVWNNGIDQNPKSLVWANIGGGTFANNPRGINGVNSIDLGRTIAVKGNLTSGNAVIATASMQVPRPVFLFFKDGALQGTAYAEWGGGSQVSMWKASKIIPLTTERPLGYIWSTGNFRSTITYVPVGDSGSRGISFNLPTSHWWTGSGTYDKNVRAIGYTEFNGCHLLAAQNGWSSGGVWYHRLYVSDITGNPVASSLANGFIFDSREGNKNGTSEISGTGYAVTGMTSSASFDSKKQVLGTNDDETGDIIFGHSEDGNAVQVYMLTTDQGLFAYEITRYRLE